MSVRSSHKWFSVVALLPLFIAGCSSKDFKVSDDPGTVESALEKDNGGLSTSNEEAAFGDNEVEALAAFDETNPDALAVPDEVARAVDARRYTIVLLWGHLPSPRDATDADVDPIPVTWNGSVSIDAGAIRLKKTLKFDARDKIVPRTDPKSIGFESHTLPYVDGLLLSVIVPAGGSTALHFNTAALNTDIDLSSLAANVGGAQRLADGKNGLFYIGYPDAPDCANGFVFGRWNKLRPHLGVLRGRVVNGNGDPLGHVRGLWGHARRTDKDVFFGKYIDPTGAFRGLFGGTYGDGEFQGVWGTVEPRDAGKLEGYYSDGYARADGRGVYIGRWSERCQ